MNKKLDWKDDELNCEFCDKQMTEEDHNFCDICGDCRDEHDLCA